ncbi:MAG: tonb-dependent receptor plug [Bacteroidetes bacterium]|nr:MAG: tonb-dependent receptor plug [Bacteroidota bacterium]
MRKFVLVLALLGFAGVHVIMAQTSISGKVTNADDGKGIPGATVIVKDTKTGVTTDLDGMYVLKVPAGGNILVFSFVGMKTKEVVIGTQKVINVVLEPDIMDIEGVVVTALGISREKKSLGYATQEIKGDAVSTVKSANFINSMSGKVTGVQIKKNTNMGGSTNIIVRGNKSLTGNNQVLFVIDGVPVNNDITNTSDQKEAGVGYDFGNAASDINPEDVESINVLKGAAASALYGSRAANGVVMITTKKGGMGIGKKKGIGVSVNSGFTIGTVDKSTFPEYQMDYGGGYGHYYDGPDGYWYIRDVNNDGVDEQWVVTSEDASYGAPFDPGLLVYQWDAVDPESPNYNRATPWVAAENGPITFFENPTSFTNTVALTNNLENGAYRFSYTNYKQNGLLPNSELKKNNLNFGSTWEVNKRLTVSGSANYMQQKGLGRNSTGYNDNQMGSFRQWWQTNVDLKQMEDAYNATKRNITWNWADPTDAVPIFWDNPYWQRYENYETDSRNRILGHASINYKIADWVDVFGRVSVDSYNELQEERRAIGSIPTEFGIGTGSASDGSFTRADQGSGYLRRDITSSEYNFDLMLNFKKDFSKDISFRGVLGTNIRRTNYDRIISATNGGLGVPRMYSLQNSVGPLPYPKELSSKIGVDGIYGSASFGYKSMLYLDLTLRNDHSSTLPPANSSYPYPSVAASFIFSEVVKQDWLSFGKVRLNYAAVSNGAGFDQLINRYNVFTPLNSPMTSVDGIFKNANLEPERTKSLEAGLEMYFLDKRLGFDLALYKTNTTDQILPLTVSTSVGINDKIINAGEIQNKGIELTIMGTPVKTSDLRWNIAVNWSRNKSEVISLVEGVENLQLGTFQGGITLNAQVGQPYGVLFGTDYTYADGQKIVDAGSGEYIKTSTSDHIIGDINPDWIAGISNTITYKNWALSFLIDIQQGGSIFSLDMYYGLATGMYKETSFINDLGNPVRDPLDFNAYDEDGNGIPSEGYTSASGGFINDGVNVDDEGNVTPNQTRIQADRYGAFGYRRGLPDIAFVYDASYVKLREVAISYSLPEKLLEKTFIRGITLSAVGSNLWIIHKNLPYADPESGLGAGNLQGFSTGSLPSTREFGFDIKLNF